MKKLLFVSFLSILFAFISCKKKTETYALAEFNKPIINGYYMRDINAILSGIIGEPNVYLGDNKDVMNSTYYITAYPNPTFGHLSISIISPNPNSIKKIWLTSANWNTVYSDNNANLLNSNLVVVGGSPIFEQSSLANRYTINTSNIPEGYYRLYVNVDGQNFYDNIVIYKK